ncbi:hypothetical protein OROGR_015272 [Orobanche gracilis]
MMRPSDSDKVPYVANVERIEADHRNYVKVGVRWYYRPEESLGGRRQFHGAKELFLSDHYDVQSTHTIEGKCIVHSFKNYTKLENVGTEDYFCRFEYKAAIGGFTPDRVAVYCKCEIPYNPDDLMVQCEGCKDWFHPSCMGMAIEEAKKLERFLCSDCSSDDEIKRSMNSFPVSSPAPPEAKYVVNDVSPGLDDLKNHSHDPNRVVEQSSLPIESQKQNYGRWQTAKDVQEVGVCVMGQNLDKILASADKKTMSRNSLCSPSSLHSKNSGSISPSVYSSVDFWEDGYRKSLPLFKFEAIKEFLSNGKKDESTTRGSYLKEQNISQKGILEPKRGRRFEQFPGENNTMPLNPKISKSFSCYFSSSDEAYVRGVHDEIDNSFENDRSKETKLCPKASFSNIADHCINDATYARGEGFSIRVCTRTNGDHQLESVPFILSAGSDHSSYVQEVSFEEALLNEYSEDESAYSNSSRICLSEFEDNMKRTYQQSPDSVLEPFDVQNPSTSEHFDSIGLQLQLQPLNFDSEETYSEGFIMLVSGNEDFDERLGDLSHDGRSV